VYQEETRRKDDGPREPVGAGGGLDAEADFEGFVITFGRDCERPRRERA
jgi:hypothetical protein